MADVTIKFKDGSERRFEDRGAPGGSYSQSVRYEGAFVVVKDAYDNETAFPAADVAEITKAGGRRW